MMRCAIWFNLWNLTNVKNTHGGVLIFLKLQLCKSDTSPWVFSTHFTLYDWYQIAKSITYKPISAPLYMQNIRIKRNISLKNSPIRIISPA